MKEKEKEIKNCRNCSIPKGHFTECEVYKRICNHPHFDETGNKSACNKHQKKS